MQSIILLKIQVRTGKAQSNLFCKNIMLPSTTTQHSQRLLVKKGDAEYAADVLPDVDGYDMTNSSKDSQ